MSEKDFNKAASPKINDYLITLDVSALDSINQQVKPFEFKRRLGDWVAAQTGCVPDIQVSQESLTTGKPQMLIQCTETLMDSILTQFETDIVGIERLKKFSEIPPSERGCWKPRGRKP